MPPARQIRRASRALAALLVAGALGPLPVDSVAAHAAAPPRFVYPVPGGSNGGPHAGYPAADIFKACGAVVVAPAAGRVVHVDRIDDWSPATDDPFARGGKSVAIRDRDGVRHYLAHFRSIRRTIRVGVYVAAGRVLGRMGSTGRASACHAHYGISPPCRRHIEWWVRRGVVAPQPFLADWRRGVMTSPTDAVRAWKQAHRRACRDPRLIDAH